MKAKVAFGDDIRRWHYPSQNRYGNLASFVEKVFDLGQKKDYFIQFEDAEMDKVTICNEQDLLDAFECAEQEKRQSLKIFVTAGRVSDTHETPTQAKECTFNDTKADELEVSDDECDWQKVVLQLLLNENIRCLLPELVQRVICVLREKKESGEASLAVIVPLVLKEKRFEEIVQHELYKEYAESLLPMLLSQASCFNHMLLSLNENAVEKWVADMLELVMHSLTEDKNNRLWKMHFDMWREHELSGGQAIHFHVKCDICGVFPIRGARYKCAVCEDYDLCENCEASGQHDASHPLVKMARPICRRNFEKHHFLGLREIVRKNHCRRQMEMGHNHQGHYWMKHPCENEKNDHCRRRMEMGHNQQGHCWMQHPCENEKKDHCRRRMGMGHTQQGHCWMKHACEKRGKKCKNKREEKLTKCQQKLMNKLEKINNKLKHREEKKGLGGETRCVCGNSLVKMTPIAAYGSRQVICDWCDKDCSQDSFIFHCPLNNSNEHPFGFDICINCVSSSPVQAEKNDEKENEKVEKAEVIEKDEKVEKVDGKKLEQLEKIEQEERPLEKPQPPKKDPFEGFEHRSQAHVLWEMGFTDTDRIKYLLISKKGDLDQAIFEMFQ